VPLVEVHLDSKYGCGKFLFGLVDSLPASSFHGLIGNDLDHSTYFFYSARERNVSLFITGINLITILEIYWLPYF